MMIIIYSFLSIFIAWIWVDYYRLIDIYEKERLVDFISIFVLGCASVLIVFGLELYVFDNSKFQLNGTFFNDFLFSVFRIGLIEEVAKLIPFFIFYILFKKRINEPIDYLVYISISALGFSAVENVLYFYSHGPRIIDGRAILATVGHMFDSSLIAYGIIRYKCRKKKHSIVSVFVFFLFAVFSHGFYDFWLLYRGTNGFGWIVSILYFFITISLFATILNNSLNNSTFFTYKRVVDSNRVMKRLFTYYGIIYLIQFVFLTIYVDFHYAIENFTSSFFFSGAIIIVTILRLSRFKLIEGRWNKLKFEFPFSIVTGGRFGLLNIKVKGDSFNETYINIFYEEYFTLSPLTYRSTYIENDKLSFIEKKLFFINDESYYQTKVFHQKREGNFDYMFLKPKSNGITKARGKYPIAALLSIDNLPTLNGNDMRNEDFIFREWVMLIPIDKTSTDFIIPVSES